MPFSKSILLVFISFHLVFSFWNSGRRADRLDTITKLYSEKNPVKDSTKDYPSIQVSAQFAEFNRIQGSFLIPQKIYLNAYNKSLNDMSGAEISIAFMRSRYYGYKLVADYALSKDEISGSFPDLYLPYHYNTLSTDIQIYSFGPGIVFSLPVTKELIFSSELILQLIYWEHHLNIGNSFYEDLSGAGTFTGYTLGAFPRLRCDYYLDPNWSLTFLTGFQIANIHPSMLKFNGANFNFNRMEHLTSMYYSLGVIHCIHSNKKHSQVTKY